MAVAATAAVPAAKELLEASGKFWKTLLDDLGKPGFERVKVYDQAPTKREKKQAKKDSRKGRTMVYHRTHVPGLVVERSAGKRVESIVIPRWACVAVALGGGAALAVTLDKALPGQLRNEFGKVDVFKGLKNKLVPGVGTNAVGMKFRGVLPGGGSDPVNYLFG